MPKKVLALIGSCKECPNRSYYSGGVHECTKARTMLARDQEETIPEWCPLTDYPSDAIEAIRRERDDYKRAWEGQARVKA